jgi:peptidoglycan/xylan/chitin deacetylase (PgdA/CDA1 family)
MAPAHSVLTPADPHRGAGGPSSRYRSQQPHHRRRRRALAAVLALILLVVLVEAVSGGGGSAPHRLATAPTGFFGRIGILAGTGPGSFAVTERTAENAAINRTLATTPYVRVAGAQHREMALTFDDGPGPYTAQLLAVLQRYRVPATFFEVGVEEGYFHAGTSAIVAAGDPIGDHTQIHAAMAKLSAADQRTQLLEQISSTGAWGAPYPRMFRPPYGSFNQTTLAVLRQMKMLMVLWTIDTNDYRQPGVPAIVSSALTGARPGAIVLMHDAGGTRTETVAALPQIITGLRAKGYTLVTVPKLLLDNPPSANQDISSLVGSGG